VTSNAPGVIFDNTGHKTFTFQHATNQFYRANIQ